MSAFVCDAIALAWEEDRRIHYPDADEIPMLIDSVGSAERLLPFVALCIGHRKLSQASSCQSPPFPVIAISRETQGRRSNSKEFTPFDFLHP